MPLDKSGAHAYTCYPQGIIQVGRVDFDQRSPGHQDREAGLAQDRACDAAEHPLA